MVLQQCLRVIRLKFSITPRPGDFVPATGHSGAQAEAQPPRAAKRWPGEYRVTLPASFWKRRDLSLEAKGYAALLVALADRGTCELPKWCNGPKLQHFARVSKTKRLRIESELKQAGLLSTYPEPGGLFGLFRRIIYRVNLDVLGYFLRIQPWSRKWTMAKTLAFWRISTRCR
jgi:hypothetical protein